jgi:hypothetical protein
VEKSLTRRWCPGRDELRDSRPALPEEVSGTRSKVLGRCAWKMTWQRKEWHLLSIRICSSLIVHQTSTTFHPALVWVVVSGSREVKFLNAVSPPPVPGRSSAEPQIPVLLDNRARRLPHAIFPRPTGVSHSQRPKKHPSSCFDGRIC